MKGGRALIGRSKTLPDFVALKGTENRHWDHRENDVPEGVDFGTGAHHLDLDEGG